MIDLGSDWLPIFENLAFPGYFSPFHVRRLLRTNVLLAVDAIAGNMLAASPPPLRVKRGAKHIP